MSFFGIQSQTFKNPSYQVRHLVPAYQHPMEYLEMIQRQRIGAVFFKFEKIKAQSTWSFRGHCVGVRYEDAKTHYFYLLKKEELIEDLAIALLLEQGMLEKALEEIPKTTRRSAFFEQTVPQLIYHFFNKKQIQPIQNFFHCFDKIDLESSYDLRCKFWNIFSESISRSSIGRGMRLALSTRVDNCFLTSIANKEALVNRFPREMRLDMRYRIKGPQKK